MRPIDADALIAKFEEIKGHPQNTLTDVIFLDGAMSVVDTSPTLDLAPVVHAYWERNDDDTGWFRELCFCSACGIGTHPYETKYCPSCGAKMDGKTEPPKEESK